MRSLVSPGVSGLLVPLLLCVAEIPAHAAADLAVQADREGDAVEVRAQATLAATPRLVWDVLTDYEALPRFIPGLSRSVVRERSPGRALLDQAGDARFLVFSFPIDVRLEVTENAPHWISSRAIGGNLRRMTGRYDVVPGSKGDGCTLLYRGLLEPDFALPPIVGLAAMRSMVEEQFAAMVAEIERRSAAASGGK